LNNKGGKKMETINIFRSGTLKRYQNSLVHTGKDGKKSFIPIENTDKIRVFSELNINKRLLEFLSKKGVAIYFFNYHGYYSGAFIPNDKKTTGETLLKQTDYYKDEQKRLTIATEIVRGTSKNMLNNISYYLGQKITLLKEKNELKKKMDKLAKAKTVDELMAYEALIRKTYYKSLDKIVKYPDFKMHKREKRPPTNYTNAMISYGNTLLYLDTLTEILKTQLDPAIGYLHSSNHRRFSLNLDLSEVFKPIVVDRVILSMVNKNQIKPADFKATKGGVYLNKEGNIKFLKEYEKRIKQTVFDKGLNRKISYKGLIRHEAYKLLGHINGTNDYKAFEMRR